MILRVGFCRLARGSRFIVHLYIKKWCHSLPRTPTHRGWSATTSWPARPTRRQPRAAPCRWRSSPQSRPLPAPTCGAGAARSPTVGGCLRGWGWLASAEQPRQPQKVHTDWAASQDRMTKVHTTPFHSLATGPSDRVPDVRSIVDWDYYRCAVEWGVEVREKPGVGRDDRILAVTDRFPINPPPHHLSPGSDWETPFRRSSPSPRRCNRWRIPCPASRTQTGSSARQGSLM